MIAKPASTAVAMAVISPERSLDMVGGYAWPGDQVTVCSPAAKLELGDI